MKKGMVIFGFIFFAVEILIGSIYGLSFIPWSRIGGLITEKVLYVILAVLWNIAGAIFLWIGYSDEYKK